MPRLVSTPYATIARRFGAVLASPVAVWALALSACAVPEPVPQSPGAPAPSAEPASSAIPTRGKYVVVDIASFELVAFQDGSPVLRSRVIVGRPRTPTPEMLTAMYAIRFNPSWTPTPAMVRYEGLRPTPPGPNNPLGRILFELDNDKLIYLHDTNQKDLFDKEQRALSHGCVRVEQARPLAAWALGVSPKEIDAMVARGTTFSVSLAERIPIALVHRAQVAGARSEAPRTVRSSVVPACASAA